MYRCFAAWLTICSIEIVRKSSYMISTTGRMPCIAAPIPAPTIAISEIGVLRTRSAPNSSRRPWVTPIEPPISAMSSPMMKTSSSARIAVASASRTASRYESSGIDVLQRVLGLWVGAVLRELDRRLDDLAHLVSERLPFRVRDAEASAQPGDRIALGSLLAVLLRAIHLGVTDVVPVHARRFDVEEDRSLAGASALERLARELEDLLHVLAVDLDRTHVVSESPLRHVVVDRRVLPARRRLGPLVVLAHEHRPRLPELGKVERLVERARVRRAVAEERDRDARLVAQLEREARADDRRDAARNDRVRAEVAALDVVEVHRAAVAVRAALELAVELRHQRIRVRAARQGVRVRPMGGGEHVAVLHRVADADRDCLLPDRDMQEPRQLAGPKPLLDLLFEAPDQQHLAEKAAQPLVRQHPPFLDLCHSV